jgi:hypothetical protein
MVTSVGDGHYCVENIMPEQLQQEEHQSGKSILLGIIGFIAGTIALIALIKYLLG